MPHPVLMNIACIGVPIITALGSLGWGFVSIVNVGEKQEAYDAVVSQLALGKDPTSGIARYAQTGNDFIAQFRWASLYWSIAGKWAQVQITSATNSRLSLI